MTYTPSHFDLVLISLLSGFVGAVLGVGASFLIYDMSCWRVARQNLRERLLDQKSISVWVEGEPYTSYCVLFKDTFPGVWKLFLAYRETLPFFLRGRANRAWSKYKGYKNENWTGEMLAAPTSDEQAFQRVDDLLEAIGHRK